MIRQLEIGPGSTRLAGSWTTVDCVARPGVVDQVCVWGATPLPFADDSFDLVYAAHVLEHVPWHQTLDALREARRVLAPGGRIELHVPDLDVLVEAVRAECCPDDHAEQELNHDLHWMHWVAERLFHFGGEAQWHRACFNEAHLRWCLRQVGFVEVERLARERQADHGVINLGVTARKALDTAATSPAPPSHAGRTDASLALAETPESDRGPTPELPACHSRRDYAPAEGLFFCAHPQVHAPDQLVAAELCRVCDRWRAPPPSEFRPYRSELGALHDGPCWNLGKVIGLRVCPACRGNVRVKVFACEHPSHESTTLKDCLRCPDYEQRLRPGGITTWAVGVTTAPRAECTLPRCLESLREAGWNEPRVFAEPESPLPDGLADERVTRRATTLGAWANWWLALGELYQREPTADAYLLAQDDVLFCRHLRTYLERSLWPVPQLGVVTLYTPHARPDEPAGFHSIPTRDGLSGALALVFPNSAARRLLGDPYVLAHGRRGPVHGTRWIDVVVGQWAARSGWGALGHRPSLVQHVGDHTTLWHPADDRFLRRSDCFVGDQFDARELLGAGTRSP